MDILTAKQWLLVQLAFIAIVSVNQGLKYSGAISKRQYKRVAVIALLLGLFQVMVFIADYFNL